MSLHDRIMALPLVADYAGRDLEAVELRNQASEIGREGDDRIEALETMVKVFRGCIETGQFPQQGSRLHKMIYELVGEREDD